MAYNLQGFQTAWFINIWILICLNLFILFIILNLFTFYISLDLKILFNFLYFMFSLLFNLSQFLILYFRILLAHFFYLILKFNFFITFILFWRLFKEQQFRTSCIFWFLLIILYNNIIQLNLFFLFPMMLLFMFSSLYL